MAKLPAFKDYLLADTGLILKSAYNPEQHKAPPKDEVHLCEKFIEICIDNVSKVSFSSSNNHSYHLKHAVESWFGHYVSNGAFILAAKKIGFRIEPEAPNARFNMKKKASMESCQKFWAQYITQNEFYASVTSFSSESKQHLWDEYRHYCMEKLHRCPPVRKLDFWLFLDPPELKLTVL